MAIDHDKLAKILAPMGVKPLGRIGRTRAGAMAARRVAMLAAKAKQKATNKGTKR